MSNEPGVPYLRIDAGPDRGRQIRIAPEGARIGRSSRNDIVLNDPSLSRFHCRVHFRDDGSLLVSDLGSTNETRVNGKPVSEAPLRPADHIEIGDTVLTVVVAQAGEEPPLLPAGAAPEADRIDLGFTRQIRQRLSLGPRVLWILLVAGVLIVAAIAVHSVLQPPATPAPAAASAPESEIIDVEYEKIEGDTNNVFRYYVRIKDFVAAVRIDDLKTGRHVGREKKMDKALVTKLGADIQRAGFFDLRSEYQGLSPDVWVSWDMAATVGPKTHRVYVLNRLEPEEFKTARELVEEFVQNELGLAALALPPEKLVELARDAVLQGRKYFDEQEVRNDNLWRAIKAFEEAQWYLETIEPKPDFFATAVAGLEDARRTLDTKYQDHLFRAERAIQGPDWVGAQKELRIICEMIPDRSDSRNEKALKKLLDVERHLER